VIGYVSHGSNITSRYTGGIVVDDSDPKDG
jgi:hypothetical protein